MRRRRMQGFVVPVLMLVLVLGTRLEGGRAQRMAYARFDMNDVTGTILFSQADMNSNVTMNVSLSGLATTPNYWHIHQFPVGLGCGADSTGGHYDPTNNAPYASGSCGFYDCEAGDLSGKFGAFNASSVTNMMFSDDTISLWGNMSFIGRSIVLHQKDGTRYACATIYPQDANVATVTATFDAEDSSMSGIDGTIKLMQPWNDPDYPTWVLIDLTYAGGSSTGHPYHVHQVAVDEYSNSRCSSTMGHYEGNTAPTETCSLRSEEWANCELGDLSGKHGTIDIDSTGANKVMYVDTNLPLSGPNSVAGRSIVIHKPNGERMACATLGKVAVATFEPEDDDEDGALRGYIQFVQPSVYHDTNVTVNLTNNNYSSNPYHVHKFMVTGEYDDCGNDEVGGHYNPNNGSVPCNTGNLASCEAGDLSGRNGAIPNDGDVWLSYVDSYIDLFGEESIVGRSVVIHKANGDRWRCASILPIYDLVWAEAEFDTLFCGNVYMFQHSMDSLAETSVYMDLARCGNPNVEYSNLPFHVHQTVVDESQTDRCGSTSTGGHFNPYDVDPSLDCSSDEADWWWCEAGDLASKHGTLSLPRTDDNKWTFTDTNIPLSGSETWSALNRSIVVHNVSGDRIDCADFVKEPSTFAVDDLVDDGSAGGASDDKESSDDGHSSNATKWLIIFISIAGGFVLLVAAGYLFATRDCLGQSKGRSTDFGNPYDNMRDTEESGVSLSNPAFAQK